MKTVAKKRASKIGGIGSKNEGVEIVTTKFGEKIPRKECRYIKNAFYKIGDINILNSGDCYKIDGKYVRVETGFLIYDHRIGQYIRKSSLPEDTQISLGAVGFNRDNSVIRGEFIVDRTTACEIFTYNDCGEISKFNFPDADALPKRFSFCDAYNFYTDVHDYKTNRGKYVNKPEYPTLDYVYSFADSQYANLLSKTAKQYMEDNPLKNVFSKYLGKNTFGIELETKSGIVPVHELFRYGYLPLRDGSIKGYEYTSMVLDKFNLFNSVVNISNSFQEGNASVDEYCSLHLHLGNVPRNKKTFLAIYMLSYLLQNEIEELVLPFKRDIDFLAKKKGEKDHCKRLPRLGLCDNDLSNFEKNNADYNKEVDRMVNTILKFIYQNANNNYEFNNLKEPDLGAKWNKKARYYTINFYNYLFKRNGTIEFRLHHGTLNKYKIINWIFICNAIIKFALENIDEIIEGANKISLDDVLSIYSYDGTDEGKFLTKYLKDYIRSRKREFINNYINGDIFGKELTVDKDLKYSFQTEGLDLFNYD